MYISVLSPRADDANFLISRFDGRFLTLPKRYLISSIISSSWALFQMYEKSKPNTLGPYRNEGYWQEKGQFYSETEPPPECPMHNMDKDFKKEQKKLTELNPDGD